MPDDDIPVPLDYAPPPKRRRRALRLVLALSAAHLVVSIFAAIAWDYNRTRPLAALAVALLLPIFVGQNFGWLWGIHPAIFVLVVIPLNSIVYGAAVAAIVTVVHALLKRR